MYTVLGIAHNTLFASAVEHANYGAADYPIWGYMESLNHDQIANAFHAWTRGGSVADVAFPVVTGRSRSYQMSPVSASYACFWQIPVTLQPDDRLDVTAYLRKTAAMAYLPRVQIVSQATEPLAGIGAALMETAMTDSVDVWETLSATYTNIGDSPLDVWIRFLAMNASGYVYTDATWAVTNVTGLLADIAAIKAQTDLIPAVPAAVGSAMTLTEAYDAAKTAAPAGTALSNAIWTDGVAAHLNADIDSRLATGAYVAPDNAGIAAIQERTDNLPDDPAGISDIPLAADVAAAVWSATTRTLSGFGTPAADLWAYATRTLSSLPASYVATQTLSATATSATIYQAMTRSVLNLTITSGGIAVDLSGAAVKLYVRNVNGTARTVDGEAMTITDAENGLVSYTFSALETATPGTYRAQAEITYGDGSQERATPFLITVGETV